MLTFKETESISGQTGLDLQKKTDGSVNILGEIATDEISVLMLQMAQVASLFTVFTHHAKTVSDLVLSLRNSLLKCNVFRDERIAEEQVVRVMDFDVHLNRDYGGNRYVERITEIVPKVQQQEFSRTYRETEGDKMVASWIRWWTISRSGHRRSALKTGWCSITRTGVTIPVKGFPMRPSDVCC